MTVYYQNIRGEPKFLYFYADRGNFNSEGRPTFFKVLPDFNVESQTKVTVGSGINDQTRNVAWSPDDDHIVFANSGSGGAELFKQQSSGTFEFINTIGYAQSTNYVSYSRDGTIVFIGYVLGPRMEAYLRSGDSYTLIGSAFSSIIGAQHTCIEASSDDGLLATSTNAATVRIYSRSGTTFTSLGTTPFGANIPENSAHIFKFSRNSNHFACVNGVSSNPIIRIYTVSGTTLTQVFTETLTGFNANFAAHNVVYSPDDTKLYYVDPTGIKGYTISGTTYTAIGTVVASQPLGYHGAAISPDGAYLVLSDAGAGTDPTLVYTINPSTGVLTLHDSIAMTGGGVKCAFSHTVN